MPLRRTIAHRPQDACTRERALGTHAFGPARGGARARGGCYCARVLAVRAHVRNGRLVLHEPTDLPEGSEVELEAVGDDLDDEDRARLHAALDAADEELRTGKGIPGGEIIAALRGGMP